MGLIWFKIAWCAFLTALLGVTGNGQDTLNDKHIEVALRMIGHEVLLNAGDSTSLVLPIVKDNGRYRVQFETEFEFNPEELVNTVSRVALETDLAGGYIVEVERCETGEVVYSYEIGNLLSPDIIPCITRDQSRACYSLLFTLLEPGEAVSYTVPTDPSAQAGAAGNGVYYVAIGVLLLIMAVAFLWRRRRNGTAVDPNLIALGEYRFDKRNTELIYEQQRIELTGKEADLLMLLYHAANTTVERDVILNRIWGDEGDYVGRTLDVFVSKLRKKLEFDANLKIVNIRGVGYKLVMDV